MSRQWEIFTQVTWRWSMLRLNNATRVIVSIFVNPLQFGPNEDLATYPNTPQEDEKALAAHGADILYRPSVEDVYPVGLESQTRVEVPGLSDILCGQSRPGHFIGVTTVVNRLFNQVQADKAFFGKKGLPAVPVNQEDGKLTWQ